MRVKTSTHINRPISLFSWYNRPSTGKTIRARTQRLHRSRERQPETVRHACKESEIDEGHHTTMGVIQGKLGWAGCGDTEFPTEGQTPRWRAGADSCCNRCTVFLCQGWNLFSSHYRGPGTKTLWKRKFVWAQMTVFSISLEPVPCKAQSSAQGTCWQALTLGSRTAKWKKLRIGASEAIPAMFTSNHSLWVHHPEHQAAIWGDPGRNISLWSPQTSREPPRTILIWTLTTILISICNLIL